MTSHEKTSDNQRIGFLARSEYYREIFDTLDSIQL